MRKTYALRRALGGSGEHIATYFPDHPFLFRDVESMPEASFKLILNPSLHLWLGRSVELHVHCKRACLRTDHQWPKLNRRSVSCRGPMPEKLRLRDDLKDEVVIPNCNP